MKPLKPWVILFRTGQQVGTAETWPHYFYKETLPVRALSFLLGLNQFTFSGRHTGNRASGSCISIKERYEQWETREWRQKERVSLQNRSTGKKLIKLESRDEGVQLCNLSPHQRWVKSLAGLSDRDVYNLPEVYAHTTCTRQSSLSRRCLFRPVLPKLTREHFFLLDGRRCRTGGIAKGEWNNSPSAPRGIVALIASY